MAKEEAEVALEAEVVAEVAKVALVAEDHVPDHALIT